MRIQFQRPRYSNNESNEINNEIKQFNKKQTELAYEMIQNTHSGSDVTPFIALTYYTLVCNYQKNNKNSLKNTKKNKNKNNIEKNKAMTHNQAVSVCSNIFNYSNQIIEAHLDQFYMDSKNFTLPSNITLSQPPPQKKRKIF